MLRFSGGNLPTGWKRIEIPRKQGVTAKLSDIYFFAPDGTKLRSYPEIKRYCMDNDIPVPKRTCFNFAPIQKRMLGLSYKGALMNLAFVKKGFCPYEPDGSPSGDFFLTSKGKIAELMKKDKLGKSFSHMDGYKNVFRERGKSERSVTDNCNLKIKSKTLTVGESCKQVVKNELSPKGRDTTVRANCDEQDPHLRQSELTALTCQDRNRKRRKQNQSLNQLLNHTAESFDVKQEKTDAGKANAEIMEKKTKSLRKNRKEVEKIPKKKTNSKFSSVNDTLKIVNKRFINHSEDSKRYNHQKGKRVINKINFRVRKMYQTKKQRSRGQSDRTNFLSEAKKRRIEMNLKDDRVSSLSAQLEKTAKHLLGNFCSSETVTVMIDKQENEKAVELKGDSDCTGEGILQGTYQQNVVFGDSGIKEDEFNEVACAKIEKVDNAFDANTRNVAETSYDTNNIVNTIHNYDASSSNNMDADLNAKTNINMNTESFQPVPNGTHSETITAGLRETKPIKSNGTSNNSKCIRQNLHQSSAEDVDAHPGCANVSQTKIHVQHTKDKLSSTLLKESGNETSCHQSNATFGMRRRRGLQRTVKKALSTGIGRLIEGKKRLANGDLWGMDIERGNHSYERKPSISSCLRMKRNCGSSSFSKVTKVDVKNGELKPEKRKHRISFAEDVNARTTRRSSARRNHFAILKAKRNKNSYSITPCSGKLIGWTRVATRRKSGKTVGLWDVSYYAPDKSKLRSKPDVLRYISFNNLQGLDASLFCFSEKISAGTDLKSKYFDTYTKSQAKHTLDKLDSTKRVDNFNNQNSVCEEGSAGTNNCKLCHSNKKIPSRIGTKRRKFVEDKILSKRKKVERRNVASSKDLYGKECQKSVQFIHDTERIEGIKESQTRQVVKDYACIENSTQKDKDQVSKPNGTSKKENAKLYCDIKSYKERQDVVLKKHFTRQRNKNSNANRDIVAEADLRIISKSFLDAISQLKNKTMKIEDFHLPLSMRNSIVTLDTKDKQVYSTNCHSMSKDKQLDNFKKSLSDPNTNATLTIDKEMDKIDKECKYRNAEDSELSPRFEESKLEASILTDDIQRGSNSKHITNHLFVNGKKNMRICTGKNLTMKKVNCNGQPQNTEADAKAAGDLRNISKYFLDAISQVKNKEMEIEHFCLPVSMRKSIISFDAEKKHVYSTRHNSMSKDKELDSSKKFLSDTKTKATSTIGKLTDKNDCICEYKDDKFSKLFSRFEQSGLHTSALTDDFQESSSSKKTSHHHLFINGKKNTKICTSTDSLLREASCKNGSELASRKPVVRDSDNTFVSVESPGFESERSKERSSTYNEKATASSMEMRKHDTSNETVSSNSSIHSQKDRLNGNTNAISNKFHNENQQISVKQEGQTIVEEISNFNHKQLVLRSPYFSKRYNYKIPKNLDYGIFNRLVKQLAIGKDVLGELKEKPFGTQASSLRMCRLNLFNVTSPAYKVDVVKQPFLQEHDKAHLSNVCDSCPMDIPCKNSEQEVSSSAESFCPEVTSSLTGSALSTSIQSPPEPDSKVDSGMAAGKAQPVISTSDQPCFFESYTCLGTAGSTASKFIKISQNAFLRSLALQSTRNVLEHSDRLPKVQDADGHAVQISKQVSKTPPKAEDENVNRSCYQKSKWRNCSKRGFRGDTYVDDMVFSRYSRRYPRRLGIMREIRKKHTCITTRKQMMHSTEEAGGSKYMLKRADEAGSKEFVNDNIFNRHCYTDPRQGTYNRRSLFSRQKSQLSCIGCNTSCHFSSSSMPAQRGKHLLVNYNPPQSPYGLIQETLYKDPWKLLVSTIFLNRTNSKAAIPVLTCFFKRWPDAESTMQADWKEIAGMLQPIGLHEKRSRTLIRFSEEFLTKDWLYPIELFGIGKYGNDSYRIFCLGEWREVEPTDTKLNLYHEWITEQERLSLLEN